MTSGMEEQWVPKSLEFPHTFLGLLYISSSYDDVVSKREVERLETAALRQDIIHIVGGNLTNPESSVADHNIRAVVQLIAGDVISGAFAGLRFHMDGLTSMIKLRGGLHQLDPILASMASWLVLEAGIINEVQPMSAFIEYSTSRSVVDNLIAETVPESPLWCPHGHYVTLKRSIRCSQRNLQLVDDVRHMVDSFLDEVSFNIAMNASFALVLRTPSRRSHGIPFLNVFQHQLRNSLL